MKRASGAASPYALMQRPSAGGPSSPNGDPVDPTQGRQPVSRLQPELANGDPVDPTQRSQPVSGLQPELANGDPVDPTQRSQPVSRLVPVVNAKRTKPTRRAQRSVKPTKRRATSRRR